MRWSRRVNMPSLYLKWKNSGICSSPRGEAALSLFLSLSLQCWSLILDCESVIPFWLIEFTLYCKLMLLLHISRLFSSTHLLASYQTSRFSSSPVYSQRSFYWLFKIDAQHAYQAATYFCMRLSNPQWESDSHCVLRTVLRTVCTLHVRCFLQVFILHQFWHGTDTCCLIGFPSSQIDMMRGYKQLLNQECSQQSLTADWTTPLGTAATTRALQKWNWSSKTTDHRLGRVPCLKSLLSPGVTVSATVHGHKLAWRTLTSLKNFFMLSNTKLRARTTKWLTSFLDVHIRQKLKTKHSFLSTQHTNAKSDTKRNEGQVASADVWVYAVALFIWFNSQVNTTNFVELPLDVLQLKNTMWHQYQLQKNSICK